MFLALTPTMLVKCAAAAAGIAPIVAAVAAMYRVRRKAAALHYRSP